MLKKQQESIPSFKKQLLFDLKTKWSRKLGSKKQLPWMRKKELDLLVEVLSNLNPKKCLEWGSGFSTVYFPDLLESDASWLSIEHNEEWFNIICSSNKDPRVEIVLKKADQEPYTDPKKDGAYDDFKSYIEYPKGVFDFIFIDGRARKDCIKKAFSLITDNGLVVLHDANRVHYYEHIGLFKNQMLFDDYHDKHSGVWLGSKETKIEDLVRIDLHKKVWRRHDILAKILKPF